LSAAEEAKRQAVADAEERVRQEMGSYIAEAAHLQGKVGGGVWVDGCRCVFIGLCVYGRVWVSMCVCVRRRGHA
jgi:hypothetical protein